MACACSRCCAPLPVETHLVMSRAAEVALAHETTLKVAAGPGARRLLPSRRRHSGLDLLGLVHDAGHDRRALLDPQHVRDRLGRDLDAADPRRRCDAEGAPPPGADGARDAAASGPSAHHGGAGRDGRGHRPAGAGLLRPAGDARGHGGPHARPRARPVRPRDRQAQALGRGARGAATPRAATSPARLRPLPRRAPPRGARAADIAERPPR